MKSGAKTLLKTLQAINNAVSVKEEPMDEGDPDKANHSTASKSSAAIASSGKHFKSFFTCFAFSFWCMAQIYVSLWQNGHVVYFRMNLNTLLDGKLQKTVLK